MQLFQKKNVNVENEVESHNVENQENASWKNAHILYHNDQASAIVVDVLELVQTYETDAIYEEVKGLSKVKHEEEESEVHNKDEIEVDEEEESEDDKKDEVKAVLEAKNEAQNEVVNEENKEYK